MVEGCECYQPVCSVSIHGSSSVVTTRADAAIRHVVQVSIQYTDLFLMNDRLLSMFLFHL